MDKVKDDKIKINSKILKTTEDVVKSIFDFLLIKTGSSVSHDKGSDTVIVNIDTDINTGILIGKKGETINSFQTIISTIVRKKIGGWVRVVVNISDWRERQNERIESLAKKVAERVRQSGDPQNIYNLDPAQRRIVHLTLSEDKELIAESSGEGKDRFITVSRKSPGQIESDLTTK